MRGGRGGGASGGSARGLDLLRELRPLSLRELRALERPPGTPERIELGSAVSESGARVAIAVSSRDGADLIGWAHVAALLSGGEGAPPELLVAAPAFLARTRRAAERTPAGATVHLCALPALTAAREIHALETFPAPQRGAPARTLYERVVRVLEGAVAMTGVGAVREIPGGHVVYMRGVATLRCAPAPDGVAIWILEPERRHVQITEESFPRWGVELSEITVALAQDPRLLDDERAERESGVAALAEATRTRVTGRYVAWSPIGVDPLDWVGIDAGGRPVAGVIRREIRLADVPALLAGLDVLAEQRELWTPGAQGRPRAVLAAQQVESRARSLLAALGLEVQVRSLPRSGGFERAEPEPRQAYEERRERLGERALEEPESKQWVAEAAPVEGHAEAPAPRTLEGELEPRRGRRRGRRRRGRGRRDGREGFAEGAAAAPAGGEEPAPGEAEWRGAEPEPMRATGEGADEAAGEVEADVEDGAAVTGWSEAEAGEADDERDGTGLGSLDDSRAAFEEDAAYAAAEREAGFMAPGGVEPEDADLGERAESEAEGDAESIDSEVAAALVEEPADAEEPAPERPAPRRVRRARAAIVVRDDPASILAALVLARDRRQIVEFRVFPQEELVDWFKFGATDLADNVDLLAVGFTAQPVPHEVIAAAALFRGRLTWFDHHEWAIEDVEALRDAIGRDSIVFTPGALSPLPGVVSVAERRSRFTDKLVELSAQRLSENDMQRWGNRVVALVRRLSRLRGDRRNEVQPVLNGKPTDLPDASDVYAAEQAWIDSHDPRLVYFGDYPMVVVRVPGDLDAGEVARRLRQRTGARLSLASREGDPIVVLGCNEERRHINALGLVERLEGRLAWAHARPGGDRIGRIQIDDLEDHPERFEGLIGEIVRNKSVLYG
jgi:hypothetical protein